MVKQSKLQGARTVYDMRDPDKTLGRVITVGDEVSEVKWEDGFVTFTTNDYLRTVRQS